jgi:hypothetical protein
MEYSKQQLILLFTLLTFYCLPQFGVLLWSLYLIYNDTSQMIDARSPLSTIIVEISTKPTAYTNTIQQMILPVAAAVTAATRDVKFSGIRYWIFLLPLLSIFVCILNSLLFNIRSSLDDAQRGLVSQFFISAAGNLSIYVMLLVGLKMSDPKTP